MKRSYFLKGLAVLLFLSPGLALGHHPMGSETPQTMIQGLLSGLGHPIIDVDHLVFIVALGALLATLPGNPIPRVIVFLGLTAMGAMANLMGLPILGIGTLVLLTIAAAGLLLAIPSFGHKHAISVLAAAAGLLHGFEYADAIIGARTMTVTAYFLGFLVIQACLLFSIWAAGKWAIARLTDRQSLRLRQAGGGICIALVFVI